MIKYNERELQFLKLGFVAGTLTTGIIVGVVVFFS
jgi:hypothetical protein